MINHLNGVLVEKQPTRVVVEVGGIGYEVLIPLATYDRLPREGEPCRLLVHQHLREDAQVLFGFFRETERLMFRLLMGVSGVGPKIALSVLSGLNVREIRRCVAENDLRRMGSVSGVGKKLAERIVVELRHRITEAEALEASGGDEPAAPEDARLRDAVLALIALGYKQTDARRMVQAAMPSGGSDDSVEDLVRRALTL